MDLGNQSVTPFLWFNDDAEEAVNFYISVIKNSKIIEIKKYETDNSESKIRAISFQLSGREYIAFNGGPYFKFNEAISLYVNCESQEEVDELWDKFSERGVTNCRCGWLKDKWGLSWQIIPSILPKLLNDNDKTKAGRVHEAMMKMTKIIIKDLESAYDGNNI
jgi:predicted 3-demethylubiquinone-9 3-methyltransferase (glyoxalase superfamily)